MTKNAQIDELRSAHFKLAYGNNQTDYQSQANYCHQPYASEYDSSGRNEMKAKMQKKQFHLGHDQANSDTTYSKTITQSAKLAEITPVERLNNLEVTMRHR